MTELTAQIAQAAAPWVLEHGLDYASAKRKAVAGLGLPDRTAMPDNAALEAALREHIALFLQDSQPAELLTLRRTALVWMKRLAQFRPHLSGAVWNGTATQHSLISLQLFADDTKMVDIWLLNEHVAFDLSEQTGVDGKPTVCLVLTVQCPGFEFNTGIVLLVHEHDALRQAKRSNALGQALRGDLATVEAILA
jgi:hypothetical protein